MSDRRPVTVFLFLMILSPSTFAFENVATPPTLVDEEIPIGCEISESDGLKKLDAYLNNELDLAGSDSDGGKSDTDAIKEKIEQDIERFKTFFEAEVSSRSIRLMEIVYSTKRSREIVSAKVQAKPVLNVGSGHIELDYGTVLVESSVDRIDGNCVRSYRVADDSLVDGRLKPMITIKDLPY